MSNKKTKQHVPDERSSGGLQSLDVALPVLFALAEGPGPIGLGELARRCNMPASKIHRYVSSFVHVGLMEQRAGSRLYDLGPAAMRLGISAIGRNRFTDRTIEGMAELSERTGLPVHVSVWGTFGPVIIRWEREPAHTVGHLGLGATLSLLDSSAGRVFLGLLPERVTRPLLQDNLRTSVTASEARRTGVPLEDMIAGLRRQVIQEGVATTDWPYFPSVCSLAAPVKNWQGDVEAVVTVVGLEADKGLLEPDSPIRSGVLDFTSRISIQSDN